MSSYSPNLRIELITTGDQVGTWGTTTNTNLGTLLEDAIAGYTSVSVTTANQALTANNGSADQSRNVSLALTTTTTAAFAVYAPPAEKTYVIYNASSYTATIYNSTVLGNTTAAGVGAAIPAGKTATVWSDGTNFRFQNNHLSSLTLASALPVASGGTGGTTSTGSGAVVLATSPTLVTPALGTPSSGTLTNATGLPLSTGVTGTLPVANGGTGVTTSTGSGSVVLSTSPTLVTPALGTPSSGTLTNATGLPLSTGVTGTLPVGNGGTGATSISSGALVKGNGSSAFSAASASDIVTAIGSTAVTNATNATNLVTSNFSIVESGGSLLIKYGATTIVTISSGGAISAVGDITAYYGS